MPPNPTPLILAGLLLACATPAPTRPASGPRAEVSSPAELCRDRSLEPGDFCMAVERVEPLLGSGDGEILYHEITESGTSRPAVVAQFAIRDRMLRAVLPGPPLSANEPVRVSDEVVQLGLTRKQIDAMERRVLELLERVDPGEVDLY